MNEISLSGLDLILLILLISALIVGIIIGLLKKKTFLFAECLGLVLSFMFAIAIRFDYDYLGVFSMLCLIVGYAGSWFRDHL